jgi:hypothetical protein
MPMAVTVERVIRRNTLDLNSVEPGDKLKMEDKGERDMTQCVLRFFCLPWTIIGGCCLLDTI